MHAYEVLFFIGLEKIVFWNSISRKHPLDYGEN